MKQPSDDTKLIYDMVTNLQKHLGSIERDLYKSDFKIDSLSSDFDDLKVSLQQLKSKINSLDNKVLTQEVKTKHTNKILTVVSIVASILLATFTYYSEYLSNSPSASEQQKNIDLLWVKYNKLMERHIDGKTYK
jgi:regulator of replication initiation timing